MKKFLVLAAVAIFSLVLVNVVPVHPEASNPSSFRSLQPFEHFAKGAGEGVAYKYLPRTKAEFVALLRDKILARKEMRVNCDVLVRQMMETHPGLSFEGCEGSAAQIEHNSDFTVMFCGDEMFSRNNLLAVTNKDGSAWGAWHRECLPDERVLTYKGQPLVSLTCLNVAIPVVAPAPRPAPPLAIAPPPIVTTECPNGWAIIANAWDIASMSHGLRKEAEGHIAAANARESGGQNLGAYQTDALSRTLGKRLREQVRTRAVVTAPLSARYVDIDPQTKALVARDIGVLQMVSGIGTFRFADDPRPHIVELIFPQDWRSPANSGGERRLRIFPGEWGTWCELNVHGIVP